MFRSVASLMLAGVLAATVSAQTGPVNPTNNVPATNFQAQGSVSEQAIAQTLQSLGLQVQEKVAANGGRFYAFMMQKDGWNFAVEVHMNRDQQGKILSYSLVSPLGNPLSSNVASAALLKVLEGNLAAAPAYFFYRPADQRICMILTLGLVNVQLNGNLVQGDLNQLVSIIRATQQYWNVTAQGPVAQPVVAPVAQPVVNPVQAPVQPVQPVVQPPVNPVNVPNPQVPVQVPPVTHGQPQGQVKMAGSVWSGHEQLDGFGNLTFEFGPDGQALMIDAQSRVNGTWTMNGNTVVLSFQNCVYTGQLNGQSIVGSAQYTSGQGAGKSWSFQVNLAK